MIVQTHLWITGLGILLLNLSPENAILAILFGVGIDIDHILPIFYDKNVKRQLKKGKSFYELLTVDKIRLHTVLHEPISLPIILIISLIFQNYIPVLFFAIHIFIDQVILKSEKQPFYPFNKKTYTYGLFPSGTKLEIISGNILSIISIILLVYRYFFV